MEILFCRFCSDMSHFLYSAVSAWVKMIAYPNFYLKKNFSNALLFIVLAAMLTITTLLVNFA